MNVKYNNTFCICSVLISSRFGTASRTLTNILPFSMFLSSFRFSSPKKKINKYTDAWQTRTMNYQKCSQTQCRQRSGSGLRQPSPANSPPHERRATKSRNSARSRTQFALAFLSIASIDGSRAPHSCSFRQRL